jgi:hypothetical protein
MTSTTLEQVISSCDRSLSDWRNSINKYSLCQCRESWHHMKQTASESDEEAERYKQFINKCTGNREIHIINCGHVWYGVK